MKLERLPKTILLLGIGTLLIASGLIIGATYAQKARAQGLCEYSQALGLPVCLRISPGQGPGGKAVLPKQTVGQVRVPAEYLQNPGLGWENISCEENELPMVIWVAKWSSSPGGTFESAPPCLP